MSEEFRKSILNRLPAMAPTRAPWADTPPESSSGQGGEEQVEESLENEAGDSLVDPSGLSSKRNIAEYSPLSASSFFDQALEVQPDDSDTTFRVYLTEPLINKSAPSLSSGISSSGTPLSTAATGGGGGKGALLVTHHGAGAGGLSMANLAKEVKDKSGGELGVLAFDCRGHGKTKTTGNDTDLSLPTLVKDFIALITQIFPDPKTAPALILLGHSMGSAPILAAAPNLQKRGFSIPGVVVLDVVEGTALESLPLMKTILNKRPTTFKSVTDAIMWHVQSATIRNTTSARVSVPSIVVPAALGGSDGSQVWRTDLLATEPYWEEWYQGLSSKFLTSRCARLLVLAGQERLDRELMVGQMQGKFQLEVLQDVGHYLHEDNPERLASILVTFWRRNTQVIVLPPKIGSTTGPLSGRTVEVKHVGEI